MKNRLFLSTVISLTVICSCQKQDSNAEAQLAQRKTELDVREEAVAQRERAVANPRIIQSQRQAPDAAQAEADRQRRIQQLPPELRALIPDRSRMDAAKAEKDAATQGRAVQTQRNPEESRKRKMFGIPTPAAEAPEADVTSPSPSPTPQ